MRILTKAFTTVSAAEQKRIDDDECFLKSVDENKLTALLEEGRAGADLNVADDFRTSAVHKATRHADIKILTHLVEGKAMTEFPDKDGARPIAAAIRFDNPKAVELFLGLRNADGTRQVDLLQVVTKSGNTLLHEAAWYDRQDCAKLLLETGAFKAADIDKPNKHGQTAMHVAAFRATEPFLQLLVSHGASVEQKTSNPRQIKRDSMEIAMHMGKDANAKYLQDLAVALASIRFAAKMKKKAFAKKPPKPAAAKVAVPATERAKLAAEEAADKPTAAPRLAEAPPGAVVSKPSAVEPAGVAQAAEEEERVFHIRFEYDLKLFTADLEKSFLAQLAKCAGVKPEEVVVLSRTAGSVILEVALRGDHAAAGLTTLGGSSLETLTTALGYPVLERAVKPKGDAPKADAPNPAAAPKAVEPKADEPKADEPTADEPKADAPKADAPKADAPKADDATPTPAAAPAADDQAVARSESPSKAARSTPGYDPMKSIASPRAAEP